MIEIITTAILLFLVLFSAGEGEIVTKPRDTEAIAGHPVHFNCSSSISSEVRWMFYSPGDDQQGIIVYENNQLQDQFMDRFRVEADENSATCNLVIDAVTAADAGKYECQDDGGLGANSSAQLIVLDSNLACQSNIDAIRIIGTNECGIEPSTLLLSCSATFSGNEPPVVQWKKDGNEDVTGTQSQEVRGNLVIHNLSMIADPSMSHSYFTCSTTRPASTEIGCQFSEIVVEGTSLVVPVSDCHCNGHLVAIIIIVIMLTLVFILVVATMWGCLKKRVMRRSRRKEKTEPSSNGGPFGIISLCMKRPQKKKIDEEKGLKEFELEVASDHESSPVAQPQRMSLGLSEKKAEELAGTNANSTEAELAKLRSNYAILEKKYQQSAARIKELEATVEKQLGEIKTLKADKKQQKQTMDNLENLLYPKDSIDYADKPKLVEKIKPKAAKPTKDATKQKTTEVAVNGIAVLEKELFVINDGTADIEVYNTEKLELVRTFSIDKMENPMDITSSKVNKCLYAITSNAVNSEIFKIKPVGEASKSWLSRGRFCRLSTYQSNLIVCLQEEQIIQEYSEDGDILITVLLSHDAEDTKFSHPWHAIKVTDLHFVVSHGSTDDDLHRVCVVNKEGNILRVCATWEKTNVLSHAELNVPVYLLEDSERRVLVVDRDHKRILLLSSVLKYERKLLEEQQLLKDFPTRICFDETRNRLFVATNKGDSNGNWTNGRILVFNMRQ